MRESQISFQVVNYSSQLNFRSKTKSVYVKNKTHALIDDNFYQSAYGRLLHHHDSNNPNVLHYSVQINRSEAIGWEPTHSERQKDTRRLAIWKIKTNFQLAEGIHQRDGESIKKALHVSVDKFHKKWQYELFRFNCEHWARLVTTGDCRCYQMKEFKKLQKIPVLGIFIVGVSGVVTGAWEHNGYAQKVIQKCCQSEITG